MHFILATCLAPERFTTHKMLTLFVPTAAPTRRPFWLHSATRATTFPQAILKISAQPRRNFGLEIQAGVVACDRPGLATSFGRAPLLVAFGGAALLFLLPFGVPLAALG